jgi:general secretion pathway protein D
MTKKIFKPFVLACAFIFAGGPCDSGAQEEPSPNVAPEPGSVSEQKSPPPSDTPPPASVPAERRLLPPPTPGARPPAAAPAAPGAPGGMISLNFTRADLVEIIHIIAQHLRLTYTIDPEVKGTVTINSAEPLRSEDLLPIFHQVLRMNGAVAVRSGNLYRIVPIKDAKAIARPAGQSREDSFALQIVPVRYFTVGEMKRLLTPFLMAGGEIVEVPRGNFLVITDLPSNIQRLVEIAELVDVQVFAGTRMEVYQPKVASAEELAQEMIKIMQSFAASTPQAETFTAQFIPLPRINQLLIVSHSEAAWSYAKRWLERIDVVAEGPGRRVFIYPVENSKAIDLADVLGQALGLPTTTARTSSQSLQSLHRSTPGGTGPGFGADRSGRTTPQTGGIGTGMTTQQSGVGSAFATIPAPGQTVPPAAPATPTPLPVPGQPRLPTPATPGAKPEEQLRIVADPGTNSLIIYGTVQEFQNIKNILRDLDAVPRQVLMDVLIAEVTLNNDESLGIDYQIGRGNTEIFGRTFDSRGSVLTGILGKLGAANAAGITQFPAGISGVIGSGTVRALINALQADTRIRILSSPSVLATDNRPARIQVGTEEPIATGQVVAATGAADLSSSTTIQYRNTGRIVTIIPQVNSQGLVNLQILAEVSQRGANVLVGDGSFPSFDTRQAETTAVVQDGDTLAIGGIITENKSRDRSGIPYLMDVPVFGRLFGSTSDVLRKTELIMLITPNVIRTRQESYIVTEDFKSKLSAIRSELERIRRERERELERQRQLVPPSQGPMPAPAPAVPGSESQPQPEDPSSRSHEPPLPPAASPDNSGTTSSNASPKGKKPPLPDTVEIRPLGTAPKAPARSVPTGASDEFKELPKGSAAQTEDGSLASSRNPASINLAKSRPDESANNRHSAPAQVWAVQVASYAREADARVFAANLKDKGYSVHIVAGDVAGQARYRVEIGPLLTRHDAVAIQKELTAVHKLDQALLLTRSLSPSH